MPGRVLLISENAPVPADRRVWNISRTLTAAGWEVVIVCAQGADRDSAPYEVLEGIEIHRYPLRPAGGALGYAREYLQALWRIRRLVRRLARSQRFDVVHACNPPDVLLLAARSLRRQAGSGSTGLKRSTSGPLRTTKTSAGSMPPRSTAIRA